jgi:hypothetical protein
MAHDPSQSAGRSATANSLVAAAINGNVGRRLVDSIRKMRR